MKGEGGDELVVICDGHITTTCVSTLGEIEGAVVFHGDIHLTSSG